jgi:hypothetical protein
LISSRGGVRVHGALGLRAVRDSRALKNVVGCGYVLDTLLFIRKKMKIGKGKQTVFAASKKP